MLYLRILLKQYYFLLKWIHIGLCLIPENLKENIRKKNRKKKELKLINSFYSLLQTQFIYFNSLI